MKMYMNNIQIFILNPPGEYIQQYIYLHIFTYVPRVHIALHIYPGLHITYIYPG